MRRLLNAVCELIEAHAARVRTETFEAEMENADWALMSGDEDD
jgi:predicted solute-binding protein